MKGCTRCRRTLDLAEFGPDVRRSDGRKSRCRRCCAELARTPSERTAQRRREKSPAYKQHRNAYLRNRRLTNAAWRSDQNRRAVHKHQMDTIGMTLDALAERDGWRCYLCTELVEREEAEPDHVVARARGGLTIPENVALTHRRCNRRKSHMGTARLPWAHPSATEREALALAAMAERGILTCWPQQRRARPDRVVHAEGDGIEVVRYLDENKWYIEVQGATLEAASRASFAEAVEAVQQIQAGGGLLHLDRPGGRYMRIALRRRASVED